MDASLGNILKPDIAARNCVDFHWVMSESDITFTQRINKFHTKASASGRYNFFMTKYAGKYIFPQFGNLLLFWPPYSINHFFME